MTTLAQHGYTEPTDPCSQRVVCDVLTSVVDDLDTTPPDGAELRARLVHRRHLLQRQLMEAALPTVQGRPLVLDPTQLADVMSRQGQPLTPVVTAGTVLANALSSAEVRMPPLHTSKAHVHHDTDIVLIITTGHATTLWWDQDGILHHLPQHAGQHLFLPRHIPHAAINPGRVQTIGVEIRSNPNFSADNELLPHLDPQVTATMAAIAATA